MKALLRMNNGTEYEVEDKKMTFTEFIEYLNGIDVKFTLSDTGSVPRAININQIESISELD